MGSKHKLKMIDLEAEGTQICGGQDACAEARAKAVQLHLQKQALSASIDGQGLGYLWPGSESNLVMHEAARLKAEVRTIVAANCPKR